MKSTMEILTKLQENSQKNHDEIFTRLYRYLLRPDIYFIAYQHLYSNKGAGTKGVNDDTADGFSEQYVTAIIEALRTGSYEPKPVRRTYIQKKNGKLRPLGLPVFADKLVQEAIRMILEAIYEPIFSIYSHGFRPGRSCHTALAMIKHEFTGAKWFIEGDIKGCFDNIDHSTLIGVLNRKIKDARFLNLIRMFLKSGYMEDWDFHETYSGCPQGGIISPILANIYLNEVDRYITQLKKEFDHGYNPRNFTEEYNTIRHKRDALHEKIKKAEGTMREQLIAQHKQLTKQLFRTPAKACTDMSYAKVLGATNRQDGYLEGNGYLVSWCVGHLVELAPPNVYDEKYVKWSIADLPILPQKWQYLVSVSTKKQFGILQKLMHRPDVDSIVNSCDAG